MERLAPLFARDVDYHQELRHAVDDCRETRVRLAITAVIVLLAGLFLGAVASVAFGVTWVVVGLLAVGGFAAFNEALLRRSRQEMEETQPPERA